MKLQQNYKQHRAASVTPSIKIRSEKVPAIGSHLSPTQLQFPAAPTIFYSLPAAHMGNEATVMERPLVPYLSDPVDRVYVRAERVAPFFNDNEGFIPKAKSAPKQSSLSDSNKHIDKLRKKMRQWVLEHQDLLFNENEDESNGK